MPLVFPAARDYRVMEDREESPSAAYRGPPAFPEFSVVGLDEGLVQC
jgi:hypothetical protein